jgi:hypothetical protein
VLGGLDELLGIFDIPIVVNADLSYDIGWLTITHQAIAYLHRSCHISSFSA